MTKMSCEILSASVFQVVGCLLLFSSWSFSTLLLAFSFAGDHDDHDDHDHDDNDHDLDHDYGDDVDHDQDICLL